MKNQLTKKFRAFILALMMISTASNAQIVYSDIPDSICTGSYNLDLNSDGITDFVITHSTSRASGACYGAQTNRNIKVTPTGENQVADYASGKATKMNSNTLIDASTLTWSGSSGQLMSVITYTCVSMVAHANPAWHAHGSGSWYNAVDGYLGLKLIKNGNICYGWVRMNTSYANSFTVKSFGFDSTPGHFILAGATSGEKLMEEQSPVIEASAIDQVLVAPNPVSGSAIVSFSIPRSENISMKIYDLNGRLISTLADGTLEMGEYQVEWDASDVNAGIYFLKMETNSFSAYRKLIVTK